ncbi:hypothetical protein D3C80_1684210 [compost metagenome]
MLVAGALVGASGFFLQAGELATLVSDTVHPPMHVQVFTWVACEGKAEAGLQPYIVTLDLSNACIVA